MWQGFKKCKSCWNFASDKLLELVSSVCLNSSLHKAVQLLETAKGKQCTEHAYVLYAGLLTDLKQDTCWQKKQGIFWFNRCPYRFWIQRCLLPFFDKNSFLTNKTILAFYSIPVGCFIVAFTFYIKLCDFYLLLLFSFSYPFSFYPCLQKS